MTADGDLIEIGGSAFVEDASEPGKLKVRLDGMPVDAPYWVLALGGEDGVSRDGRGGGLMSPWRFCIRLEAYTRAASCRCAAHESRVVRQATRRG